MRRPIFILGIIALTISNLAPTAAQSGGAFSITKSVIAGGGGSSAGGTFVVDGTIGQPIAGTSSSGGSFTAIGGFWNAAPPAVINVIISGRVTTPSGQGLRNAIVSLIDPQGVRRIATTSSFGLYSFEMVATGQSYTLTVGSKRYRFAPRFLQVQSSLADIDFTGLE